MCEVTVRAAQKPRVVEEAEKRGHQLEAAAVAAAVALQPLAAEAAVTPSLKNLISSLVAGGTVLALIAGAVITVSGFDKIGRR